MKKKILFVSYGGGHIRLLLPIIKQLQNLEYQLTIIGLTTARIVLEKENMFFKSYKDYIHLFGNEYLKYGEKLAKKLTGVQIDKEETICYLGLNYLELVNQYGKVQADREYKKRKRQAFLPITVMKKIIADENPDLVITTNSPRSEQAAVMAAKLLNIKSFTVNDDLGSQARIMSELLADYIAVASNSTKEALILKGVKPKQYFVTGNPNFDDAFNYQEFDSGFWKKTHLPKTMRKRPLVGFYDQHAYIINDELYWRTEDDIIAYLNDIYDIVSKNNYYLVIRHHPSQSSALYEKWIQDKVYCLLVNELDLYPLIASTDCTIGMTSTVLLQSLYVGKPVIQIKYQESEYDLDLYNKNLSVCAHSYDSLNHYINHAIFNSDLLIQQQTEFKKVFPSKPATDSIVKIVNSLLV